MISTLCVGSGEQVSACEAFHVMVLVVVREREKVCVYTSLSFISTVGINYYFASCSVISV